MAETLRELVVALSRENTKSEFIAFDFNTVQLCRLCRKTARKRKLPIACPRTIIAMMPIA